VRDTPDHEQGEGDQTDEDQNPAFHICLPSVHHLTRPSN
jgi:hypothetical protein